MVDIKALTCEGLFRLMRDLKWKAKLLKKIESKGSMIDIKAPISMKAC